MSEQPEPTVHPETTTATDPPTATQRRFFSADSLDRAIIAAAGHYGVAPDELAYQQVEKQHGFTKRRKVVIRVDPLNLKAPSEGAASQGAPSQTSPSHTSTSPTGPNPAATNRVAPDRDRSLRDATPTPEPAPGTSSEGRDAGSSQRARPEPARRPAAPRRELAQESGPAGPAGGDRPPTDAAMIDLPSSPQSLRSVRSRADATTTKVALEQVGLLLDLAGLDLDAEIFEGDQELEVELRGADADLAIEDEGQVLRAIEHLLPRLMQPALGRIALCRVDCESFQLLREEGLRVKAQRAAESVRLRAQSELLEPMHPADRRIVHLALVADASVTTESVGRGYFRRVSIRPA